MKSNMLFFLLLLTLSCKQNEEQTLNQIQIQETNKVDENILKTFTYEDVARYTMASIMGQPSKTIMAIKNSDFYQVSYIRKSDKKKFNYKIKFSDKTIIWANIDGRWRDSQYDEKISFIEKNNTISIIQIFSDGSRDIQEYKKGD